MCRAIGRHGAELVPDGGGVLTHCNAGGLATAGRGTALAVLYAAARGRASASASSPTKLGRCFKAPG